MRFMTSKSLRVWRRNIEVRRKNLMKPVKWSTSKNFVAKKRVVRLYNSRVVSREMKKDNLILKHVIESLRIERLLSNNERPYRVDEKLSYDAYKR